MLSFKSDDRTDRTTGSTKIPLSGECKLSRLNAPRRALACEGLRFSGAAAVRAALALALSTLQRKALSGFGVRRGLFFLCVPSGAVLEDLSFRQVTGKINNSVFATVRKFQQVSQQVKREAFRLFRHSSEDLHRKRKSSPCRRSWESFLIFCGGVPERFS